MEKKNNLALYFWYIIYAHTVAYFLAGQFGFYFIDYQEIWTSEVFSSFYRPIDDPFLSLAIVFQVLRGIIIALFLLPLRKVFFEEKYGLLKLGLIVIGFSIISTIGAPWTSFESYLYTQIPLRHQLLGYPEGLLYVALFIGLLFLSKKFGHKNIMLIFSIILTFIICFISIMGYLILINN